MNTADNKRQSKYLIVIISGLLLAVIITVSVVVSKNPPFSQPDSSFSGPSDDGSSPPRPTPTSDAGNASETGTNPSETGTNPNPVCSSPRERKSWTELNNEEKRKFLDAVNQMKNNPSQTGSGANRYEDFTVIHDVYKATAHNISAFLPWHRHFINEFEKALQSIDSSVTLPYWDWASDAANPADSVVFANDAFGGDGDPETSCVTSGAFSNWQVSYPGPHCLQRRFNGGNGRIQRWSSTAQVAALVLRFTRYSQFRSAFESTPHAAVHNAFGGDMRQHHSPNDPIFWLHHANVDRYFLAWQMEHPRSPYNGGSLNDVMQPFGVRISTAFNLPTNSDSEYCYTYSIRADSTRNNTLRKRNTNAAELQCPAHIPDEYTIRMGHSVDEVRMTEEFICDFTKRLNQKRALSSSIRIDIDISQNNFTTEKKVWRFEHGKQRELILECLENY